MYQYHFSFDYGYPAHIAMAFEGVVYYRPGKEGSMRREDEYTPKEAIVLFVQQWGGLDLDTFQHVLEVGKGIDRLVAILAIGYLASPQAQTVLVPLLASSVQAERWASAYCLGLMRDERALPHLFDLLHFQSSARDLATLLGPWCLVGV